jgi:hypothetical protein
LAFHPGLRCAARDRPSIASRRSTRPSAQGRVYRVTHRS